MHPILSRTMNLQMQLQNNQEVVLSAIQGTHTKKHLHITPDMFMNINQRTTIAKAKSLVLKDCLQLNFFLQLFVVVY